MAVKTEQVDILAKAMLSELPSCNADNYIFVCIGTDRSTGDALGPIIGTKLEEMGYNVIGTLDNPLHAVNLEERTNNLPEDKVVVAIDACLGRLSTVGKIAFRDGPLKPGAGVGKVLPSVGDYSLYGIVNTGGFMEYFVLQNTRLSFVMEMADKIVSAITQVFAAQVEVAAAEDEEPQLAYQIDCLLLDCIADGGDDAERDKQLATLQAQYLAIAGHYYTPGR